MRLPTRRSSITTFALVAIVLVALALEFGAIQELVIRGIRGGETQPLVIGIAGALVSALVVVAAIGLWRGASNAPRLALLAASVSACFHAYAALPPHRNVGVQALLLAILASGALVWLARRSGRTVSRAATG